MNVLKILIIMLVLIMSVGAACAADAVSVDDAGNGSQEILQTVQEDNTLENTQNEVYAAGEASFTDLSHEIGNATGVLNLTRDYKFNNGTEDSRGIFVNKDNFVIGGNGHTIDGNNMAGILIINATNVTLNNLKIINANNVAGSAIFVNPGCSLATNNVTFENNTAVQGILCIVGASYNSNNDKFLDATVSGGGIILVQAGVVNVDNAFMMSSKQLSWGFIQSMVQSNVTVLNSIFSNTTSNYSTAMTVSGKTRVKNTKFINLEATLTAGAIATKEYDECIIENCTFYNVSSHKNAGAIFSDVPGYSYPDTGALIIRDTTFTNCSSGFGGAILHLGGNFIMEDSTFTDNCATFDGGAVYVSYANVSIANSTFDNSYALYDGERGSFGGAIYCDMSQLTVTGSNFTGNSAQEGSALYLYDASYNISGNTFKGNVNFNGSYDDIFTVFDNISDIGSNVYSGEGSISIGNVNYATIIACEGMNLTLINNKIDVTTLPSRFDMRDWGWLTSVKNQGNKNACWAFGSSGAIESSILRFLGIDIDLSENNMEDMSLRYFMYGMKDFKEGNSPEAAVNYALSWFGVFGEEYDVYDQLGKISPIFAVSNSIHFQDVVIVPPRQNSTDNDAMKWALLKYGALFINYHAVGAVTEQYYDGNETINHGVTVVGWDDNREIAGAPGKGAWIIKNTWGADRLENGFMYVSYYDTRLSTMTSSYAFPLENTVIYNKNYQYDIGGRFWYLDDSDQYRNIYLAVDDDLIAGVGTYFNDTNVEYTIRIYVNDKLVLVQSGLSPFSGYHTVKLDSYVPIKEGDEFIIEIKSNAVPISFSSRQHYVVNSSQQFVEGEWQDTTVGGYVNCVKAYTLADDTKVIDAKDISVDYDGGKYFSVTVVTADGHAVGAGEKVKFTINKKTTTVTTDKNGVAEIKIIDVPGKYALTTTYKGKAVAKNTVTVKQVLKTSKVTVKNTAKKFTLKATLKINGKLQKGKVITFKFAGKTYKVKTNAKGVAQKALNKNVIKKLRKGKTYAVKVTYLKDTIKTTVKVR